jgi:hypothetical protein
MVLFLIGMNEAGCQALKRVQRVLHLQGHVTDEFSPMQDEK